MKTTFLEESFDFHLLNHKSEYFTLLAWKKARAEGKAIFPNPEVYARKQYSTLRDMLLTSHIIKNRQIDNAIDYQPILYWGQQYLLCRSGADLIVVRLHIPENTAEIIGRIPDQLIHKDSRLLKPLAVECIFDRKVVDRFASKMRGKQILEIEDPFTPVTRSAVTVLGTWRTSSLPINLSSEQTVRVHNGSDKVLHHLHLEYRIQDQPGGGFAEGVMLTIGEDVDALSPGETAKLSFVLTGARSAPNHGRAILLVASDEDDWGWVTIHYTFRRD